MVKVEIESQKDYKEVDISCPRCGSQKVRIERKGYDYSKGFFYSLCCFGWPGLLCGGLGSKQLEGFCFNCGNRFDVERVIKEKWGDKEESGIGKMLLALFLLLSVTGTGFLLFIVMLKSNSIIELTILCGTFVVDYLILYFFKFLSPPKIQEKDFQSVSRETKERMLDTPSMYCSKCGTKIFKDDAFCKYCGNKINL